MTPVPFNSSSFSRLEGQNLCLVSCRRVFVQWPGAYIMERPTTIMIAATASITSSMIRLVIDVRVIAPHLGHRLAVFAIWFPH